MIGQLREKGYDAYILEKTDTKRRKWYFVRWGHFQTREDAQHSLSQFNEKENIQAIIALSK